MIKGTIVVTGSTGFLGRHLLPLLKSKHSESQVVGLRSKDYDLMDPMQVRRMFAERKPDILIHLAAYSGGIGADRAYPADFFFRNIQLTSLAFQGAAEAKISKMIYTMGGCSYPAKAPSPINEEQMWEGYPQPESAGYSVAKKMGIVASTCYRTQYGLNSVVLIPGNMYGEYDNFRYDESHVIPGLIRRFYEAKLNAVSEVVAWGSGTPERDFVYVSDVAAAILYFIEQYDCSEPVNISTGTRTTIKYLTHLIAEMVGYEGTIRWDTTKPDGQMIKIFDTARLHSLGLSCPTSLEEGLRKTINWLSAHYAEKSDGIRL